MKKKKEKNFQLATYISCYSKGNIHENDVISYYVSENSYIIADPSKAPIVYDKTERIFMMGKKATEEEPSRVNDIAKNKIETEN